MTESRIKQMPLSVEADLPTTVKYMTDLDQSTGYTTLNDNYYEQLRATLNYRPRDNSRTITSSEISVYHKRRATYYYLSDDYHTSRPLMRYEDMYGKGYDYLPDFGYTKGRTLVLDKDLPSNYEYYICCNSKPTVNSNGGFEFSNHNLIEVNKFYGEELKLPTSFETDGEIVYKVNYIPYKYNYMVFYLDIILDFVDYIPTPEDDIQYLLVEITPRTLVPLKALNYCSYLVTERKFGIGYHDKLATSPMDSHSIRRELFVQGGSNTDFPTYFAMKYGYMALINCSGVRDQNISVDFYRDYYPKDSKTVSLDTYSAVQFIPDKHSFQKKHLNEIGESFAEFLEKYSTFLDTEDVHFTHHITLNYSGHNLDDLTIIEGLHITNLGLKVKDLKNERYFVSINEKNTTIDVYFHSKFNHNTARGFQWIGVKDTRTEKYLDKIRCYYLGAEYD